MSTDVISVTPVGFVRVGADGFVLEVLPQYRAALKGLEGFSHVNVLWWSHLLEGVTGFNNLVADAPYRNAPAQLGMFATRSPLRPNSICLSAAPVVGLDEEAGKIYLGYIDAEDGTPVLDIKPYHPCSDRVRDARVPAWCQDWPQCFEDSGEFDWSAVFDNAR